MLDDAGAQIVAALEVLAAPDALPGRLPLHGRQGPHRRPLGARALAAGRARGDGGGRLRASGEAMARLRAKLIFKYPEGRDDASTNIDEVFSADPAQMELLLDHLRERYGSVDAYVAGLGARAGLVDGLRAALLEPAALGGPVARPAASTSRAQAVDGAGQRQVEQVRPPESCVVRTRRTVFQRMSMSGWWLAASAAAPTALTNVEGGGEVVQLDRGHQLVALAGPVRGAARPARRRRRPR